MLTTAMPQFPSEAISKNVYILSNELRRMGHEVRILTIFGTSKEFKKYLSSINPLTFLYHFFNSQKRLNNELNLFQPHIALTHFGLIGTNFILNSKSDAEVIPFIYPYPSSFKECFFLNREIIKSNLQFKSNHVFRLLSALCLNNPKIYEMSLKRSSLAIFSSENLNEAFGRWAPKSKILNLALSSEEISSSEQIILNRMFYRKNWNLSEKDLVIGFLGHASLMKGVDLAIETFVNLSLNRGRKVKMMLATSPLGVLNIRKLIKKLSKSIRKNITILGYVPSIEFIGTLDLLLFPLRSHIGNTAIPRTILESILAGTPIIVGNANFSIQKMFSGSKIGYVTTPLLHDIVKKSNEILDNQESFRKRVLEERSKLIQSSNVKKVAKDLENILLNQIMS